VLKELTIAVLERTLADLNPVGYKECDDRILVGFDGARNAIYPAKGRTPQQMTDITKAYQEATMQVAKTSLGRDVPEKDAYVYLAMLGKNIPLEGFRFLLTNTLDRLKSEAAIQPEALEAAR
jgi:hypothetical protein